MTNTHTPHSKETHTQRNDKHKKHMKQYTITNKQRTRKRYDTCLITYECYTPTAPPLRDAVVVIIEARGHSPTRRNPRARSGPPLAPPKPVAEHQVAARTANGRRKRRGGRGAKGNPASRLEPLWRRSPPPVLTPESCGQPCCRLWGKALAPVVRLHWPTGMADACSVTYSTTSPNDVENKSGMLSCSSVSRVVV